MESALALLVMAVFFRFVIAFERNSFDEHSRETRPGPGEAEPMTQASMHRGPVALPEGSLYLHGVREICDHGFQRSSEDRRATVPMDGALFFRSPRRMERR
jgi:hypothetical protein